MDPSSSPLTSTRSGWPTKIPSNNFRRSAEYSTLETIYEEEGNDCDDNDDEKKKSDYHMSMQHPDSDQVVFVLLYMLHIPSHEYFILIDFIVYLCHSGWFRISMEIDFVTHCHVISFIK